MIRGETMKYEVGYIVACLENYEIMKHEYELAYMDLMKELSELDKNIISLGINYGERVQSSRISDTTYEMYARKEEKTRILQKRINNVSDQVIVPITISNPKEVTDAEIIREYLSIVSKGFAQKSGIVHLGKRSHEAKFLKEDITGRNIDWFTQKYGGESWNEFVSVSRKEAYNAAVDMFKKRSNIKGAREEMERTLSARMANSDYYGMSDEGIELLKKTQKVVLEAMKKPKVNLEAAAFIMMIGDETEDE